MVKAIRNTEQGIGCVDYELTGKQKSGKNFSRSLYFVEDIKQGYVITHKNVKSIRPGWGLHPKYLKEIIGKTVNVDVEKGDRVNWELINK
jgi:pseudaminic acid synthase